jgi:Transposase DDE domain
MDRDTFIITVYCLVEKHYQHLTAIHPIRHSGFAPQLSDVEVITMIICGEFFKRARDTDLFAYFRAHYRHFFPALTDRTLFVRQAANLWQLHAALQRRLVWESCHAADPVQVIDTLPLPVCTYTRGGRRDHCFPGQADYGDCAAKQLHYYGFKLGLRITRCGLITHYALLAARPHDLQSLDTLVDGYAGGLIAADKGFIDQYQHTMLAQHRGIHVVTPSRARMTSTQPLSLVRTCARWRKVVETVGSQLTAHFAVAQIRVRDLWHFQHRLIRKVLAHTVGVFLHLQMGRQPLDLDGILTV